MQSKGAIKFLTIVFVIACVYQLMFSFKTYNAEKKAAEYAAAFDETERPTIWTRSRTSPYTISWA